MKKTIFARLLCTAAVLAALAPITALAVPDNLYVSANQGGSIFEYTPAGVQSTFASYPTLLPRGLAFDSNGNLFAAVNGSQGNVIKINPGGVQSKFGGSAGFLEGVAVDSTGDVFVMSQNRFTLASTIFKFTPSGTRSTFASELGQGFGLAFNSAGNLFAVDIPDRTISEYTPGGTRTTFAGPAAFGNESPLGQLAFDSAGNLFVSTLTSDFTMGSILEFTPGGTESTFATGLRSPRGLAFDNAGNLFVTENVPGAGDILEFTPGGIETVFASGLSNPQFLAFEPARGPAGPPHRTSLIVARLSPFSPLRLSHWKAHAEGVPVDLLDRAIFEVWFRSLLSWARLPLNLSTTRARFSPYSKIYPKQAAIRGQDILTDKV